MGKTQNGDSGAQIRFHAASLRDHDFPRPGGCSAGLRVQSCHPSQGMGQPLQKAIQINIFYLFLMFPHAAGEQRGAATCTSATPTCSTSTGLVLPLPLASCHGRWHVVRSITSSRMISSTWKRHHRHPAATSWVVMGCSAQCRMRPWARCSHAAPSPATSWLLQLRHRRD